MRSTTPPARPRRSKLFLASLVFSLAGSVATGLLLWSAWRTRAAGPETTRPAFVGEELSFTHGKNHLVGTYVRPTTPGPYPVVVFVTDAGDTDRTNHGAIPPLAQRLATQGFASFSWDRPGLGGSSGDHEMQTIADRANEVAAALHCVKDRPEVAPDRVGLAGFGQGGMVAPLVAGQASEVAFLITISASQVVGWEQELYRLENELRADGFHPTLVAEAMEVARLKGEAMNGNGTFEEFDATQKGLIGRPWFEYAHYCERERFAVEQALASYDPAPSWGRVRCPVLALYGAKDTTIPLDASMQVVRHGLAAAGNRALTIKILPKADHLLRVSDGGGRKEAAARLKRRPAGAGPEFTPGYCDTVSGWLAARFGER